MVKMNDKIKEKYILYAKKVYVFIPAPIWICIAFVVSAVLIYGLTMASWYVGVSAFGPTLDFSHGSSGEEIIIRFVIFFIGLILMVVGAFVLLLVSLVLYGLAYLVYSFSLFIFELTSDLTKVQKEIKKELKQEEKEQLKKEEVSNEFRHIMYKLSELQYISDSPSSEEDHLLQRLESIWVNLSEEERDAYNNFLLKESK